jgi:hypothetical protein
VSGVHAVVVLLEREDELRGAWVVDGGHGCAGGGLLNCDVYSRRRTTFPKTFPKTFLSLRKCPHYPPKKV